MAKEKSPKTNYIDNKKFLAEIILYQQAVRDAEEAGTPKPRVPEYIGECFIKIATNLIKRPRFFLYTYHSEMISDAILNSLSYMHNFDPTKSSNPFAYFTRICWNAFFYRISRERKQQYVKYKATENFGILDEDELMELGDGVIPQIQIYNNLYEFISVYETQMKEKKAETAKKTKKGLVALIEEDEEIIILDELIEDE